MPEKYEAIKEKLIEQGMSKKKAKKKAAKIYNAQRGEDKKPVTPSYDKKEK